jgi:hypothetical protein
MQANSIATLILQYIMSTIKLTTTNIGVEELKHLRKLSTHHKLKQVEFINSAIGYFRKTGINPSEEIYSPREEIEMLKKRVEEVIKFLQVHEKQKLSPLMERLILLEKKLSENTSKESISINDLNEIGELIATYKNSIEGQLNRISIGINKFSENVNVGMSAQYELQKNTAQLIGLLFECIRNRNLTGKMNEIDIKNFENAISKIR